MATTGTKLTVAHTVNTSGATVGQGTEPELVVKYSTDDAAVSTPTWLDATPKVRSFSVSRGRDNELSEIDAGTATLTLDNRTRTFDPVANISIRPMNRWWIREQFTGETQDIFKGYAESYDQTWPGGGGSGDAVAIVNAVDEFKILALDRLQVTNPPRDTYADVVMSDAPSSYWRFSDNSLAATVGSNLGILLFFGAGGFTILNETPIIGDIHGTVVPGPGGPNGSLQLASTQALITAAATEGGDGEASGLVEIGVEFWFRAPDATPAALTRMVTGPGTTSFLQWELRLDTIGKVRFSLSPGSTQTTVTSTTVLQDNVWYHLVGTVTGGNMRLYINGVEEASTAWASTIGPLSGGSQPTFVIGASVSPGLAMDFDEVAFYRYGIPGDRVLAHYQAGAQRGFPHTQLPGLRANAVLDSVKSQRPRFIQAGTNAMAGRFMHGQPPLDELRAAQKAESVDALLFVARDGTVTYLADGHRSTSPWNTVQATFDDDGTDLPYYDLDLDFSEAFLFNEWNVTPVGGVVASASDTTSISKYLKRSQSLTDLAITSSTDASAIASAMLAKYKDPLTRITQITLLTKDPAVSEAVFRRDIGDRIRIFRTPPGGGARIDQTAFIQGIQVTADAHSGVWKIVWNVSPV